MSNMELWSDVVGYEGRYEVSTLGRVRSVDRTIVDSHCKREFKGVILTSTEHNGKQPYYYVSLSSGGVIEKELVHRLVATAFIDNPDGKPQVNHKDCNVHNNTLKNLEWVTNAENTIHAYDNNLNSRALTTSIYSNLRHVGDYRSLREACNQLGLKYKSVFYHKKGQSVFNYKGFTFLIGGDFPCQK